MRILLVTHGKLGMGLLDTAQMLIGTLSDVDFIEFEKNMGLEELEEKLKNYFETTKTSKILVLVDILGGTPFNSVSMFSFNNDNIRVVYGINLPTFIECYNLKEDDTFDGLKDIMEETTIGISEI